MNSEIQNNTPQRPFYAKWANIPFSPAKCPFFYGWVIVAISTLSIICSVPGQTNGVSLFTDYLIDVLGITRSHLAAAYLIGTVTSGLLLPSAGKLLDRIGVRFMSLFASVGLAISLLILSQVDHINTLLATVIPFQYLPVIIAAFAFLMIRFFGQGNMTMVGRVAMGKWFNRWRGIATAIAGIPIAFSFNSAPWMMENIIDLFGWRQACWVLAIVVGGIMGCLGILLLRDKPEYCGLVMDGKVMTGQNPKKEAIHKVYRQYTRGEAVRTAAFWGFALGLAAHSLIITAVSFHMTDIGAEMHKSKEEIVKLFFYTSFIAIPVRFLTSFLVDNTAIKLRWILTGLSSTMLAYTTGLMFLDTSVGWWSTIACYGVSSGFWGVLQNVTFPRYFGRDYLGAISGLGMSTQVIASAMGPYLFSFGKSHLGSYQNTAMLILILPIAVLILSLFANNPQLQYKPQDRRITE